jgi:hypothetical protein
MAKLSIEDSNASRFSAFALTLAAADRRNKRPEPLEGRLAVFMHSLSKRCREWEKFAKSLDIHGDPAL